MCPGHAIQITNLRTKEISDAEHEAQYMEHTFNLCQHSLVPRISTSRQQSAFRRCIPLNAVSAGLSGITDENAVS